MQLTTGLGTYSATSLCAWQPFHPQLWRTVYSTVLRSERLKYQKKIWNVLISLLFTLNFRITLYRYIKVTHRGTTIPGRQAYTKTPKLVTALLKGAQGPPHALVLAKTCFQHSLLWWAWVQGSTLRTWKPNPTLIPRSCCCLGLSGKDHSPSPRSLSDRTLHSCLCSGSTENKRTSLASAYTSHKLKYQGEHWMRKPMLHWKE